MTNIDNDLVKSLLEIAEERRREYGERIWRTVEYFTVVLTAILSVSIGLFIELSKTSNVGNGYDLLIILFVLGIFVSVTAWFNVRREYEHQLEAIVEIGKAQQYLGLTSDIPQEKRWFKQDSHIILERYLKDKGNFQEDKEWVKDKMRIGKYKQAALIWFGIVFWFFALVFTVALVFIVYLLYPTFVFQINAYWFPFLAFAVVFILCCWEQRRHTHLVKSNQ
jgi:Flp pilus assembly protein TadB